MRDRVLPVFSRYFSGLQTRLLAGTADLGVHRGDRAFPMRFELVVDGPLPATGAYPDLVLDATSLGLGPVPLAHGGNGRYAFVEPSLVPVTGNHVLPVRLASEGPDGAPVFIARLQVVPVADLVVVEDSLPVDWTVENAGGAEAPVATSDGPVFAGERALELRVASSSFTGWRLNLSPPQPIDPFGYSHLRFAFHPGTLAGRALNLNIGAPGVPLVSPRLGLGLVDLAKKEWQIVEVDLAAIGVAEPFGRINFNGTVEGTFYIDDMRLVAAGIEAPAITAVMERQDSAVPEAFALDPSYPNPFNGTTVIPFALGRAGGVELAVYDLLGQRVATLVRGERLAGAHTVRWDGRDEAGRELASGAYLVRLQGGAETTTRKVLLLR